MLFALPTTLAFAESPNKTKASELRIEGNEGLRIRGFCISSDGTKKKDIDHRVPAEIQSEFKLSKCNLEGVKAKESFSLRFFHNRELVYRKDDIEPTAGIEIVIPWP